MSTQTTKEQANEALQLLTAEHGGFDYFQKAEVIPVDSGYGVDVFVDKEKWEAAKEERRVHTSLISVVVNGVPVCVMVVG